MNQLLQQRGFMECSLILHAIILIIPLSLAFLGISPKPKAQTALEVYWWVKSFEGACPSSTYADLRIPIYIYVGATTSEPCVIKG